MHFFTIKIFPQNLPTFLVFIEIKHKIDLDAATHISSFIFNHN